jgi:3-dehydroquinate dehydratase / shikimate dehydrogenase
MESYGSVSNRSAVVWAQLTVQQSVVELILSDMVQAKAQGADVVEVRLDHITDFQPPRDLQTILITNKPLPILIVYR